MVRRGPGRLWEKRRPRLLYEGRRWSGYGRAYLAWQLDSTRQAATWEHGQGDPNERAGPPHQPAGESLYQMR